MRDALLYSLYMVYYRYLYAVLYDLFTTSQYVEYRNYRLIGNHINALPEKQINSVLKR